MSAQGTSRTPANAARAFLYAVLTRSIDEFGDDCILWPHYSYRGYGKVNIDGTPHRVHRVVAEKFHGACPEGMECRHLCGVKLCMNPLHLAWGSRAENQQDIDAHGARLRGDRCSWSKITEAQAGEIRTMYRGRGHGPRMADIAAQYGISTSMVHFIISGKRRSK